MQVSQQLLEQQQAAAAKEADMTHAADQLQEQLLRAQAGAEETQAAAKLKQIEHESQAQALSAVCSPVPELLHALKQSCSGHVGGNAANILHDKCQTLSCKYQVWMALH